LAAVELFFFYLLGAVFPLSLAAINGCQGALTLFFLGRLARGKVRLPLAGWLLVAFLAWNVVAALMSPYRSQALVGVLNYWSWSALFVGLSLPGAIREKTGRFADFLALGALAVLPWAAAEFLFGTDIFHGQALRQRVPPGTVNAFGFFSHHLTYAGSMSVALFFLLGMWLYGKRDPGWAKGAGAASAGIGLATSMARTYYLAALPAGAVLLWGKGRRRALGALAAAAVAAAAVLLAGPATVRHRITSIADMSNPSNAERIYLWRAALHMWADRPLAGWGPGIYEHAAESYKAPYASRIHYPGHEGFQTTSHCHNLYLMVAVQTGALGLLLFLAFCAAAVRRVWSHPDAAIRFGVLAAFAAFLAGGFFEFNGGDAEVATLMFFLLGLSLAPPVQMDPAPP
jgi:O-antigen ligase